MSAMYAVLLLVILCAVQLTSHSIGHIVKPKYYPYPVQITPPDVFPGRYVGRGMTSYLFGGRDAELYCSFRGKGIHLVSNIIWMKIDGPYPYYREPPPYYCGYCTYRIFPASDYRYRVYEFDGKSVLHIQDVRPSDFGIYRCSATSQVTYGGYTETVFQIVKL